jgi:hypothetical protein
LRGNLGKYIPLVLYKKSNPSAAEVVVAYATFCVESFFVPRSDLDFEYNGITSLAGAKFDFTDCS